MDAMVRALSKWERGHGRPLDFVLQVGDFEPHRDEADLATMAAPSRYRVLGDFPDYAAGRRRFPWPLYFVGGNDEPYGLLDRLAPGDAIVGNCTYLGRVGVHRIAGLGNPAARLAKNKLEEPSQDRQAGRHGGDSNRSAGLEFTS